MPKFNTLREWICVLPRIRKYIDIKTYGQWFSSTGYENFCNNIGEKDAKLLDSLVYNIEMKYGETVKTILLLTFGKSCMIMITMQNE